MNRSMTTSIRLSPQLRAELEATAKRLHRGKNWIISQALAEYIERTQASHTSLTNEAKRQSLLVSKKSAAPEEIKWQNASDTEGWV